MKLSHVLQSKRRGDCCWQADRPREKGGRRGTELARQFLPQCKTKFAFTAADDSCKLNEIKPKVRASHLLSGLARVGSPDRVPARQPRRHCRALSTVPHNKSPFNWMNTYSVSPFEWRAAPGAGHGYASARASAKWKADYIATNNGKRKTPGESWKCQSKIVGQTIGVASCQQEVRGKAEEQRKEPIER